MIQRERWNTTDDRLIIVAVVPPLVPFSETTPRRAIARGELKASQPNRDGKLVIWRSMLIAWATGPAATDHHEPNNRRKLRPPRPSSRRQRRTDVTDTRPDHPPASRRCGRAAHRRVATHGGRARGPSVRARERTAGGRRALCRRQGGAALTGDDGARERVHGKAVQRGASPWCAGDRWGRPTVAASR
jgi:hypothetical protein